MPEQKETPDTQPHVPGVITATTNHTQSSTAAGLAPPTPPTTHQAANLRRQGFRVVPTNGKVATTDGFGAENPDFTCGAEWFGEPGTRVGILCGPCPAIAPDHLLCVDVDGPARGVPVLAAFLASLPPTLTSHQGRHLFFRATPDAATQLGQWPNVFRTKAAHGAAIDLKWAGGYACEAWDWAPGTPVDALARAIAPLPPDALAALVAAHGEAAPAGETTPALPAPDRGPEALRAHGFDPADVRADAEAWLRRSAPLPAEGTGGATMLVVFGALMVGFGLDDETALELAIDVYAERAWPDEDPDVEGFEHKIDEIDRHGSERFEPFELAVLARAVRRGAELTRPDAITAALAALPMAADDLVEEPAAIMKRAEDRLRTLDFRLARNQKGELKNTAFNTALVLDLHPMCAGLFGYDEFTHNVVFLRDCHAPELRATAGTIFDEDHHAKALQVWFGASSYHEPNKGDLIDTVHLIAKERRFHAVRAYLERVRGTWDGIDRNLSVYLGAEQTRYHRTVCAKWLRSAVARALVPGVQADNMLILEGNQGLRKSSVLKGLCPDVRWFYAAASRMVGSKDFMQDMNGKWICEIPEVDQLISSRDESELKALITRTTDNYRPSYARKSQDFDRQLVLSGTTNKPQYLRDHTGNRRYWAVECGLVDDAAVCRDRDQIWAQALHEYETGVARRAAGGDDCVWWLAPDEVVLAEDEQAGRLEDDPWAEPVRAWIAEHGSGPEGFSVTAALGGLPGAKPSADQTPADMSRMTKLLRKMGLDYRRVMVGGHKVRRWFASVVPGGEPF